MLGQLTAEDLDLILDALKYKKKAVNDYEGYPSYEFKQGQLQNVENVIEKVRAIKPLAD